MLYEILIGVTLTYALGALVHYPPLSSALVLFCVLSFVSFILWLKSRPRMEAPEFYVIREKLKELQAELEKLKSQQERMILNGGRR